MKSRKTATSTLTLPGTCQCVKEGSELATLLLDARWLNVRGKVGGILGLKADFAILDNLLQPFEGVYGMIGPSILIITTYGIRNLPLV